MKKKLSLFVLFFCLISYPESPLFSQTQKFIFQHLSPNDGLPPMVNSVLKGQHGFMWFATINGLYRYDGQNFKSYTYQPNDTSSISGNMLFSYLFEDSDGTIWVGTRSNGLNRYNRKTETFKRFKHNLNNPGTISSNRVSKIFQDASGTIWVATNEGLNKYHPATDEFSVFKPDPNNIKSGANEIWSMFVDSRGVFWVGTENGLFQFDVTSQTFDFSEDLSKIQPEYKNTAFREIVEDNQGVLWFGTNCGLIGYNHDSRQISRFSHSKDDPLSMIDNDLYTIVINPYSGGNIFWMSSTGGLIRFDRRNKQFAGFKHDPLNPNSLSSNILWGVYLDETGTLWIATENAGVDFIHLKDSPFSYYDLLTPGSAEKHSATSFCLDSHGSLWVGSHNGGLFQFDQQKKIVGHQDFGEEQEKKLAYNYIRSIYEDKEAALWLGISGGGIFKYSLENKFFKQIPFRLDESNTIYRIFEDSFGILWIRSSLGLLQKDKTTGEIVVFADRHNSALKRSSGYNFYEDKEKCLWIGTDGDGVFMLPPENREEMLFINFKHHPDDPTSISSNIVNAVREDSENNLWLATSRGVNKFSREHHSFKCIYSDNGLGTEFVYHLEADNNGNLFLSTENGFLKFDPSSSEKEKAKVFRIQDGLPFDDIFPYFFYKDTDGKMYVGGRKDSEKGFFVFNPDSIQQNEHIPPIVITNFKIRNETVKLDSNITILKHINLKFNQNYFSFDFAALDFKNPSKNHYAFMLEGYDNDWVYPGNRAYANYTSVPSGDYTFRVKGSNNDGKWNEQGANIGINISKPPWSSWWANMLYTLVIIVLFYGWRRYDLKRQQLKQELEIEHLESERLAELDKIKSRFFANISHEFRTPLTLIIGPINKLIEKAKDRNLVENLSIIQRNAKGLQKLINQLLSLTKLESGNMKLHTNEEDLVPIIKGYIQSFSSLADQKGIKLSFKSKRKAIKMMIDRDKLEKIMFNLLSNAFKFTDSGGEIKVELNLYTYPKNNNHGIKITVSDNGKGINPERIKNIFNRFYQAEDSPQQLQEGTGIGLSLTKELVKLHHGKIWVDSEESKGSKFTVFLPFSDKQRTSGTLSKEERKTTESDDTTEVIPESGCEEMFRELSGEMNNKLNSDNIPIVLIVEDNDDMRTFIRGYLDDAYRVLEASDGEEGFTHAITEIPDLIVSDVMMPKMDGNELCNKLKTDERTSHIPVILLTAKSGSDSKIEGLEAGADAYLTKPFDGKELMVRVKNLIKQRLKLREFFKGKLSAAGLSPLSGLEESGITSMDQKFIEKAIGIVEERMPDPDFSVQVFGQEMAMSRIQLHRKLKAIANQSASTFVRTLRLKRAALLLSKQAGNVTEIAYDVGFNNLSYFAKCFSEQYDCTPSEFAAKKSSQ